MVSGRVVRREQYPEYCDRQLALSAQMHHLAKSVIGLFHGESRSRFQRQHMSDQACTDLSGSEVPEQAFYDDGCVRSLMIV